MHIGRTMAAWTVLIVCATSLTAIAVERVAEYYRDETPEPQPLLMVALTICGVGTAVSAAALIARWYGHRIQERADAAVDRVIAALVAAETDRDQMLAGIHDRIDGVSTVAKADLDKSMNWMLRWFGSHS